MNMPGTELEAWLSGAETSRDEPLLMEDWVAGFDPDRQLVLLKLGPFKRLFLRPEKFTKRFYHQVFPLTIETWPYRREVKLFDDFCSLNLELELRFQPTLNYVQKHAERIESINQHIKLLYAEPIEDIIKRELQVLVDGSWIREGLLIHEKRIAVSVCEFLTQQQLQAQAICSMGASFAEFPDTQFGKDGVYVNVLKKTFEFAQEKARELARQQRLAEQQVLREKERELEHLQQLGELQRQIQAQEADLQLQLLADKEQQLRRQRDLERRLHNDQMQHEQELKIIAFDVEAHARQQLQVKQRLIETQQATDELAHLAMLEDKKVQAEIQRRQTAQQRWSDARQTGGVNDEENPDSLP